MGGVHGAGGLLRAFFAPSAPALPHSRLLPQCLKGLGGTPRAGGPPSFLGAAAPRPRIGLNGLVLKRRTG
ncbi:hypothetical protein C4B68_12235 [Streptomyces dengpaensis]|uniref:Uncharacterized protein n=1 Tax=Streptomyces dengpaensis TaxID=2049881 RepID=A0ABM6SQJ4_9ACTN|nr:hypothetical protein C4B68_12235 [Streptomyces dengpaensis]